MHVFVFGQREKNAFVFGKTNFTSLLVTQPTHHPPVAPPPTHLQLAAILVGRIRSEYTEDVRDTAGYQQTDVLAVVIEEEFRRDVQRQLRVLAVLILTHLLERPRQQLRPSQSDAMSIKAMCIQTKSQ